MDKFLEDNEIALSLKSAIKERLVGAMYGTFIISWCIWNWEAIYITFFVSQDLILETTKQLKIDYLLTSYSWVGFWSGFWQLTKLLFGPAVSTILIIWLVSKLDFLCFKKNYSNKIGKEKEVIRQESGVLTKKKGVLEKRKKNVDMEKKIEQKMTNEEKWDAEYERIKNTAAFINAMSYLNKSLYSNGGFLGDVPPEHIAYFDLNNLTTFHKGDRNRVDATERGKYFLKRYMQSRKLA